MYVVGGCNGHYKTVKCERYSLPKSRWEALPDVPDTVSDVGVVALSSLKCLYALGDKGELFGFITRSMDRVYELNLDHLRWRTLAVRLPFKQANIPCFKLAEEDYQLYFVQGKSVYSLDPKQETIKWVKDLREPITSRFGTSHASRGLLYCSTDVGRVPTIELGV
jgi:hypothetical protein